MSTYQVESDRLIGALQGLVGTEHVLLDATERRFYSQDVYRSGELPIAVVRPGEVTALAAVVKLAHDAGVAVIPRGGGMSYTDGYLAAAAPSLTLDLGRLDRVVELSVEDRYVTVECGITWKALQETLAAVGLRTPYWGPLSGLRSTVGGALSQGSVFLGSGRHGTAADALLGLDVVLADGSVLPVGSHALARGEPFFRQFGPDLTGLFTSDCGAMGIKARATLRLIDTPRATTHLSYGFDDAPSLFAAMAAVARADLVSECFAFDPGLQRQRMKRSSVLEDARALGKVMRAAGGGLAGLKEGAALVLAGRDFLDDVTFSLHMSCDGRDAEDAERRAALLRALLVGHGREVENSIPKVMRANPFAEVTSMLGPNGERWVPVHGIVPLSKATACFAAVDAVFARHAAACKRLDIDHGYLCCTVADRGILIEPVLYWPDARNLFHERVLGADYLAGLPSYPENLEARGHVDTMRRELGDALLQAGAVHFQSGRYYRFQDALEPTSAAFLKVLKSAVDPARTMNPGSLGL